VLFTSQPPYTAIPIVEKLDPYAIYILYKLFRDCTRYHNKEVVKDLSYLGRDLKKVIMLDTNPKSFGLQPENAIEMPKWQGNRNDTDLVGMIPFLEGMLSRLCMIVLC
jgi:import inner membrane translocase subunit TIM50